MKSWKVNWNPLFNAKLSSASRLLMLCLSVSSFVFDFIFSDLTHDLWNVDFLFIQNSYCVWLSIEQTPFIAYHHRSFFLPPLHWIFYCSSDCCSYLSQIMLLCPYKMPFLCCSACLSSVVFRFRFAGDKESKALRSCICKYC